MTNGSIAITKSLLQKAQLDGFVDLVMDITQPKAWKPSPAAYSYAVKQLNLEPQQARLLQKSKFLHAHHAEATYTEAHISCTFQITTKALPCLV